MKKEIKDKTNFSIQSGKNTKWYRRLFYLISNPFYYVIKGYIRW